MESEGIKRRTANLTPFNQLSPERQKEIRSMGGKKSQEMKKERKKLKEYLEAALSILDDEGNDKFTKITKALINEAEDGNVKAYETIRDTLGEKPIDKVNMNANLSYEKAIKEVVDENEY